MSSTSDSYLVARVRGGEKAAFGLLVERYQSTVKHIAHKMVSNEHLAQELAQEAFLQAYLSLDHLREAASFRSWLYGITLNVCRTHIRQQKLNFFSLESIMGGMRFDTALFSGPTPSPEAVVEEHDLHRLILDAVNALSRKNRDATLLFYFEQLPVSEIAALLNVSVVAVKGRLHKSRLQLKQSLLALYPEYAEVADTQGRNLEMIKVTVADIVSQQTDALSNNVVILLDKEGQRLLPIWVGPFEGAAIAIELAEWTMPRPMTFAFTAKLLSAADVTLEEVCVSALEGDTYIATARIRADGVVHEVDCRPSDAINLALHMGSPVFVAESVMESAAVDISEENALPEGRGLRQLLQAMDERMREDQGRTKVLTEVEREVSRRELLSFVLGDE